MAGHAKPSRQLRPQRHIAALHLEDFSTPVTTEVMMVSFAGDLIPQRLARHHDRRKPCTVQQCPNVAVNRSDTQPFHLGLSRCQQLLRRQRPVSTQKGLAYGRLLTSIA